MSNVIDAATREADAVYCDRAAWDFNNPLDLRERAKRLACPNQAPRTASFEDAVQRVAALAGVRDLKDVPVRPVPCATCGDPIAVDRATGRITHVCRGTQVARRAVVIPPPKPPSDGLFDDSEDP